MHQDNIPLAHPDPWVDLIRGYVTQSVRGLSQDELTVERSWLDPRDPRDATVVYRLRADAGQHALVWDEVTGWRHGLFVSGAPGVRTVLSNPAYLGGGILPGGAELTRRLLAGTREPRRAYRNVTDLHDGLDDALGRLG